MNQVNKDHISSDEITLPELVLKVKGWWRYLASKWKVILVAIVLGCITGLTYAILKKPIYKADLSFALEDEKSGGGLGAAVGLASQFGLDLGSSGGGAFSGDNLLELMISRRMIECTLLTPINIKGREVTLADLYISYNKLRQKWEDKPELRNIQFLPNAQRSKFSLQQDSILGVFYRSIKKNNVVVSKIDKKLSIITVEVNSENELFSLFFTKILVKNVSDFYVNTKIIKSVKNVKILQRQTDSVRRELNAAITGVASSMDVNPNPNPGLQILRVPSQRRQVDVQANTAILTELVKNLELAQVSLRKETPLIQLIDEPIFPLEKDKVSKAKAIIAGGLLGAILTIMFLMVKRVIISMY